MSKLRKLGAAFIVTTLVISLVAPGCKYLAGQKQHEIVVEQLKSGTIEMGTVGCLQPAWSPDGRSIAFLSEQAPSIRLYLLNKKEVKPLCDGSWPSWSPDGTSLLYLTDYNIISRIFLNSERKEKILVVPDGMSINSFSASPSGGQLAVEVNRENQERSQIYTCDLPSGKLQKVPAPRGYWCSNPSWSADGRAIYFEASETRESLSSIWKFELSSKQVKRELSAANTNFYQPSCSPDGKWIAYVAGNIKTQDLTGNIKTEEKTIGISSVDGATSGVVYYGQDLCSFYDPLAWSPNSQAIAFTVEKYPPGAAGPVPYIKIIEFRLKLK